MTASALALVEIMGIELGLGALLGGGLVSLLLVLAVVYVLGGEGLLLLEAGLELLD